MSPRLNRILLVTGIIFYFILSLILYKQSEAPLEPGDGITHYQIAHFAFSHPENFLKHWGKPLFTILSAGFAQMGFVGMIVFNLVVFAISSLLLFLTLEKLMVRAAGLAPFVLMSSMVYFQMVNAGMTEILMAGLGMAAAYLVVTRRHTWAAIITSLSIVARPESIILIPMLGLLLLWEGKWRSIPWLGFGFILFTLIGFFFGAKNMSWVISEDPYPVISPYGHGNLDRFFGNADLIFGVFIIGGILFSLYFLFRKSSRTNERMAWRVSWFSLLTVLLVMLLHTYLWWKGLKGSLGLIRVIATVVPLAALLAMIGYNAITERIKAGWIGLVVMLGLLVFADVNAVKRSDLPREVSPREKMIIEAAEYYQSLNNKGRISYLDSYFAFVADIDPMDRETVWSLWSVNKKDPSVSLVPGDIIVWDNMYGPREAGIREEAITENPHIRVLKTFKTKYGKEHYIHIAEVLPGNE